MCVLCIRNTVTRLCVGVCVEGRRQNKIIHAGITSGGGHGTPETYMIESIKREEERFSIENLHIKCFSPTTGHLGLDELKLQQQPTKQC